MRVLVWMMAVLAALLGTPALAQVTVIHAGSVIRDADGEPSGPATITIEDGRIVSIVDGLQTPGGEALVIDLADKTVLPGLIDLHVHLTGDPGGDFWKEATEPDEWGVVVGAKNARITALAGFTTVREAGSGPETAFALRRGTAEGLIPGPRIVAAGVPLAIIGVTVGLLVFNAPFSFMALLGFLSLSGMLVKNGIVLVEQIKLEMESREPFDAVVLASISRVRPVCMAAITTILGMVPLLFDAFFESMAVVIMFGLGFATVLTLIVIPVLYTLVYGIKPGKDQHV